VLNPARSGGARDRPGPARRGFDDESCLRSSGGGGRGGDRGAGKQGDGEALETLETARERRRGSMAIEAAARGGSDALLTAGIAGTMLAVGLLVGFGLVRVLRSE
jgi:hypothetical protein